MELCNPSILSRPKCRAESSLVGRRSMLVATAALVSMLSTSAVAVANQCADVRCGDLDGDGAVAASDALRLLRNAIGLESEFICPTTCDVGSSTTTTTVGNTTTTLGPISCSITFRLDEAVTLIAAQFDVDYSAAPGQFVGEGSEVSCTPAGVDDDGAKRLSIIRLNQNGLTGPVDLATCEFQGAMPLPGQFQILVRDAVRDTQSLGSAGSGVCGSPVTGLARPTIRDSLAAILASVGGLQCDLCECDVNDDAVISGTDSLVIRNAAYGLPVELRCPPCGYPPEVRGPGELVAISVSEIVCF